MKCSGQIKIIGDEYCGFYSCGLTMLDSSTMGKFREECSEAPNDMLPPLHTVLKEDGKMMFELLQAKNVECDYKLYGSAEKPLYHVFHCDIKSEDAKQANDDEINFFKKYID